MTITISEPNASLYGCCPNEHPRSVRTTIEESHTLIETWCTECDTTVEVLTDVR